MNIRKNKLIIRQLDKKLESLRPLQTIQTPPEGWVKLIRKTLNMSLRQLGNKLSITPQSLKSIEDREAKGTIALNTLKEVGDALGLKLIYGFIPKDKSLEKMIEDRALEIARKIVQRTSTTMKLEDQENSRERIKQAIADLTEELKREMPKTLWD